MGNPLRYQIHDATDNKLHVWVRPALRYSHNHDSALEFLNSPLEVAITIVNVDFREEGPRV